MYRDCKKFNHDAFCYDIEKQKFNATDLTKFKETIFQLSDKHACMKRKYFRANEAPSMTKELHEAIMKR